LRPYFFVTFFTAIFSRLFLTAFLTALFSWVFQQPFSIAALDVVFWPALLPALGVWAKTQKTNRYHPRQPTKYA